MLTKLMIKMSQDIKSKLADIGFQLVNIKDKEWLIIGDSEGFKESCIMLESLEEAEKVIDLHKQVTKSTEEFK